MRPQTNSAADGTVDDLPPWERYAVPRPEKGEDGGTGSLWRYAAIGMAGLMLSGAIRLILTLQGPEGAAELVERFNLWAWSSAEEVTLPEGIEPLSEAAFSPCTEDRGAATFHTIVCKD